MKKIIAGVLAGVLALTMLAGCGSKNDENTLVVGLDDKFPPMGFRDDNNELVGLDIDLAKEVGKRLNTKVELKPINWTNKFLELDAGNVDVLWNGLTMNDERVEKSDMSRPYLANKQIIMVKADSPIQTKAELKDKVVALQKESTAVDALEKDPIKEQVKEVREFDDNVAALSDLKIGRVDAVIVDEVVGKYYANKDKEAFKILNDTLAEEQYAFAVKKGNKELLDSIQKAIDEMIDDGTAKSISEKWFGENKILGKDAVYAG